MTQQKHVVVVSDLHLHPWAAFAKGTGLDNDRLAQSLRVLEASLSKAEELECSWIFAGDWVHTIGSVRNGVLNELIQALNTYPTVDKISVWGNHDARSRGGKIEPNETVCAALQDAVKKFHLLDRLKVEYNGIDIYGVGYQPDVKDIPCESASIGIYHATVQGSKSGTAYTFPDGLNLEKLFEHHPLTIVGHVHNPQLFVQFSEPRLGHPHIVLVPGSPEHHNFGDQDDHGWWIVDFENNVGKKCWEPVGYEMVPSGSPKFLTVETFGEVRQDGNFYRVVQPVAAGTEIPDYVAASTKIEDVVNRPRIDASSGEAILQSWMECNAPDGDHNEYLKAAQFLLGESEARTPTAQHLFRVDIENFMCFESASFDVKEGVTLVLGDSTSFDSNGAGKTSLFDAIFWALFGKTTKGTSADDVIRRGADRVRVGLCIDWGQDDVLVVERSRSKAGHVLDTSFKSRVNGEVVSRIEGSSVKDIQEQLLALLGLSPEIFKALAYYSQEDVFLFSRATDSERKGMLSDLLALRAYDDAAVAARKRASESKMKWEKSKERLAVLEQEQAEATAYALNAEEQVDAWQLAHDQQVQKLTEEINVARDHMRSTLHDIEGRIESFPVASFDSREYEELVARLSRTEGSVEYFRTQLDGFPKRMQQVQARLDGLMDQWNELQRQACPTCGQQITTDEAARQKSRLKHQMLEAKKEIEDAALAVDTLKKEIIKLEQEVVQRKGVLISKEADRKVVKELETLQNEYKQKAEQLGWRVEAKQQAYRIKVQEQNPWLEQARAWHNKANQLDTRIEAEQTTMLDASHQVTIHEYWDYAFGKEGIQSLLLSDIVAAFNRNRGSILPLLTHGVFDVVFSPVSETAKGGRRERTDFIVHKSGERVDYTSLSGGERRRVDLGIMFTLLYAVCLTNNIQGILGLLILDEVFGGLDFDGAEGLADALSVLAQRIPHIYLITHDAEMQALFPNTIRVVQNEEGVSRLA